MYHDATKIVRRYRTYVALLFDAKGELIYQAFTKTKRVSINPFLDSMEVPDDIAGRTVRVDAFQIESF